MISLSPVTKKKLKIALCGAGIFLAMTIIAATPSLSHDSGAAGFKAGKAAPFKPTASTTSGINLTSSSDGNSQSSSSGDYGLQGTSVTQSDNSSSEPGSTPPSPPVSNQPVPEPDVLYPIDPTPKCHFYKYPGGIQPLSCPVCESYPSDGAYACGCGYSSGVEMMCAL